MNFTASLFGHLVKQDPENNPFNPPISTFITHLTQTRSYLVKERPTSVTGEDFDIFFLDSSLQFMTVRGSTLSILPGIDEMRVSCFNSEGHSKLVAKLKRNKKGIALYRDTEKFFDSEIVCQLVRDRTSEEKFYVYDNKEATGTPVYTFMGEFPSRHIVMKNDKNESVAKIDTKESSDGRMMTAAAVAVGMESYVDMSQVQNYKVEVASGMDPILVLSLVCAIDEEFDDEREKRKNKD